MNYLIFAMAGFLFLLAVDVYTSRNVVECDDLTPDDLIDMELIEHPIERGEA